MWGIHKLWLLLSRSVVWVKLVYGPLACVGYIFNTVGARCSFYACTQQKRMKEQTYRS